MKELKKDKLYKKKFPHNHKFTFNNEVANVFEDMVNRSVPGYDFLVDNLLYSSKCPSVRLYVYLVFRCKWKDFANKNPEYNSFSPLVCHLFYITMYIKIHLFV